ncbi:CRISPR-associated protein Cas4 [Methanobrevibacter smithii]|jgi:CRISPR-associated exonuclease, Cas4 family|uniref:CRISPR-associated exonuclease Cas4 n=1 Tax=Methanobrevibacter smithii (strain ATCC 35061 / DSM 861 / OCM 144 / PS) TaxID=420247 RepID=A5UJJ2_METS3|nr:CRISPR-associated protein Cas4 [Methanobrevibacter smithii]ABQ86370.1 predicted exonuclease [Methanobrevibacter smithii ATCC 35061]
MNFMISKINGTQINYYFICKTKLWLFSHNIQLEDEHENVKLGKFLHETSFKREKDFLIDNLINVDFIKITDSVEIHEVKKSQKMNLANEYQLLYYMFYLKHEKDIKNVVGFLNYPDSRKKKKITLTKEKERDLFEIIDNIKNIVDSSMPKPKKKRICSKCAYFEFCFS